MLDSYGRIPSGVFQGAVAHFGDYNECLDVEVNGSLNDDLLHGQPLNSTESFQGNYCLLQVKPSLPKLPSRLWLNQGLLNLNNTNITGTVS